jgi:hypothetical protein
LLIKQEDAIYEKTLNPIRTGGEVRGWIISMHGILRKIL